MCLILLAIRSHPLYPVIIAANRDEYYDRPTARAAFWDTSTKLLAGRDLHAGGTWLGITTQGRIAAVTNYREPGPSKAQARSRGKLVADFLLGSDSPSGFLRGLALTKDKYNGFNVIVGRNDLLYWYSNRGPGKGRRLTRGIYGLSNHLLDTPWPKVKRAKKAMARVLSEQKDPKPETLFRILRNRSMPDDKSLPDTGVGLEWERILSTIHIQSPTYGTRSSTLLFIDVHDRVTFIERTFNSDPSHDSSVEYEFRIGS